MHLYLPALLLSIKEKHVEQPSWLSKLGANKGDGLNKPKIYLSYSINLSYCNCNFCPLSPSLSVHPSSLSSSSFVATFFLFSFLSTLRLLQAVCRRRANPHQILTKLLTPQTFWQQGWWMQNYILIHVRTLLVALRAFLRQIVYIFGAAYITKVQYLVL